MTDLVDLSSKLPPNFYADLTSKKWQERKHTLELFQKILVRDLPFDPNGHYDDLIKSLISIIGNDVNINVASTSAKCLTGMARGLRKDFRPYVRSASLAIFGKFKEKKPVLRDALVECIDSVAAAAPLDTIVDDILEALKKPNPDIKIQIDSFLYRSLKSTNEVPKRLLKDYTPVLIKHACDSDPEVRNAACAAMGAIMKCVGSNACELLFGDITADRTKMTKIEEACAKATQEAAEEMAARQTQAAIGVSAFAETFTTVGDAPLAGQTAPVEIDPWDLANPVDITMKLPDVFKNEVISKKWQERKEALDKLLILLNLNPRLDSNGHYDQLIQTLVTTLGTDLNINVASTSAKCLTGMARGLRKDFRPYVRSASLAIFGKFKEKKPVLRDALVECIDSVAAAAPLDTIVDDILEALKKPNPDIKIQIDSFLYRSLKSTNEVPKRLLKDYTPVLIKHACDSDPEVRNAACAAMGAIMRCVGRPAANGLFGNVMTDKLKVAKIQEFYNDAIAASGVPDTLSSWSNDITSAMIQPTKTVAEKPKRSSAPSRTSEKVTPKAVDKLQWPFIASGPLKFAVEPSQLPMAASTAKQSPRASMASASTKTDVNGNSADKIETKKKADDKRNFIVTKPKAIIDVQKLRPYFSSPRTGPSRIPRLVWPSP